MLTYQFAMLELMFIKAFLSDNFKLKLPYLRPFI